MLSIPKYPEQYAQHFPTIFYLLCCASQHHVPDAIVALRAKEAPGSEAAPTWLSMLDAPFDVDDEGLEQQLESLANPTDIAAAHTARSLHALARPHAVPARPLQAL